MILYSSFWECFSIPLPQLCCAMKLEPGSSSTKRFSWRIESLTSRIDMQILRSTGTPPKENGSNLNKQSPALSNPARYDVSHEKKPGWLGFIGDYTIQLYGYYNKLL